MTELTRIIDHIYSAAVDTSAWPVTVQALQTYFRGSSAGIYNADMRRGDATLVHVRGIDPAYVRAYIDRYLKQNPWSAVPALQVPGRIRTDQTLDEHYNEPGYYRATSFFNEWMKPQGFIYTLGTNLADEPGARTKLYVYRPRSAGPFSGRDVKTFTLLSGHLMNAVKVARRLAQREARALQALHVLDRLRFGVIFLDELARVRDANRFARELFKQRDGLVCDDARLSAVRREDSLRLAKLIQLGLATAAGEGRDVPGLLALRRPGDKRPLQAMILPLPRGMNDPFASHNARAALIVTDPEHDAVLPAEEIRCRYRLTGAEVGLARLLAQGLALREAAERTGVSYETARGYLKSIFQKTGTSKQSALVRLLLSEHVSLDPLGAQ